MRNLIMRYGNILPIMIVLWSCNSVRSDEEEYYSLEELTTISCFHLNNHSFDENKAEKLDFRKNRDAKLLHTFGKYSGHIYNIGYDIDSTGHFNSSLSLEDPKFARETERVAKTIKSGDPRNSFIKHSKLPYVSAQIFDARTLEKLSAHPNHIYISPWCSSELFTVLCKNRVLYDRPERDIPLHELYSYCESNYSLLK